jgi:hypothetical protein
MFHSQVFWALSSPNPAIEPLLCRLAPVVSWKPCTTIKANQISMRTLAAACSCCAQAPSKLSTVRPMNAPLGAAWSSPEGLRREESRGENER